MADCERRVYVLSKMVWMHLNKALFCWFQARVKIKAVDFGRSPSAVLSNSNVPFSLHSLRFLIFIFFLAELLLSKSLLSKQIRYNRAMIRPNHGINSSLKHFLISGSP